MLLPVSTSDLDGLTQMETLSKREGGSARTHSALVGSMSRRTAEMRLAGSPTRLACSWMVVSSERGRCSTPVASDIAMEPLDPGTHFPQNLDRLWEISRTWASDRLPTPGTSRSMTNLGMHKC